MCSWWLRHLVATSLSLVAARARCATDADCSLLGVCSSSGSCVCDPGWGGSGCAKLKIAPAPSGGVYGFGVPFAVTSWGGNAIYDNETALWHLFVTEIAGKNCGLHGWAGGSTVVHATSRSALGPFKRQSVALRRQAHNPQAIRLADGKWYIFHIGQANSHGPAAPCNESGSGQPPGLAAAAAPAASAAPAREAGQRASIGSSSCPVAPPTYTRTEAACISTSGCKAAHCNCGNAGQLASNDCTTIEECVHQGSLNCTADPRCHSIAIRSDCSTGANPAAKRWASFSEGGGSAVRNSQWVVYSRPGGAPPPPPPPTPPSPHSQGSTLHVADSPYGPWRPVVPTPGKCNNPS
jgi:hypothetical protein